MKLKDLSAGTLLDPHKLVAALNNSKFHKYVKETTLRVLGRGQAVIFGVSDIRKVHPVEEVTRLGPWEVSCFQPAASRHRGCSFGTISPVDSTSDVKKLLASIKTIGGESAEVVDVLRLYRVDRSSGSPVRVPSETLQVVFRGPLPSKVAIALTCFTVRQYVFPVPRCYNCQRFGHFALSCKSKQICSKCSQPGHIYVGCENPPYCLYCKEAHSTRDPICGAYLRAKRINEDHIHPDNAHIQKLLNDIQPSSGSSGVTLSAGSVAPVISTPTRQVRVVSPNHSPTDSRLYSSVVRSPSSITAGQKSPSQSQRVRKVHQAYAHPPAQCYYDNSIPAPSGCVPRHNPQYHKRAEPSSQPWDTRSVPDLTLPTPLTASASTQRQSFLSNLSDPSWGPTVCEVLKIVSNAVIDYNAGVSILTLLPKILTDLLPVFDRIRHHLGNP